MECFEFGYVIKGDVNDTLKKTVEYCSDGIKQKAKVLAGYIQSDDFLEFCKKDEKFDSTKSILENKQNTVRRILKQYYELKHQDVTTAAAKRQADLLMGFSSVKARNIAINDTATIISLLYEQERKSSKYNNVKLNRVKIIQKAIDALEKDYINNVALKVYNQNKEIDDNTIKEFKEAYNNAIRLNKKIIELKQLIKNDNDVDNNKKKLNEVYKEYTEARRQQYNKAYNLVNKFGNIAQNNRNNYIEQVKRNPNFWFTKAFESSKLVNIVGEFENVLESDKLTNENFTDDEDYTNPGAESVDETTKSWEDKLWASFEKPVAADLKLYFNTIYKLDSPAEVGTRVYNYDTNNEIGLKTTMGANFIIRELYTRGNFNSVNDFIDSIVRMATDIAEDYGLIKIADDCINDPVFANRIFCQLSNPKIIKTMSIITESGITFEQSNKSLDAMSYMIYNMLNTTRSTMRDLYTENDINRIKELVARLDKSSNRLVAVRLKDDDITPKELNKQIEETIYEVLKKYYPKVTRNEILGFIYNGSNPVKSNMIGLLNNIVGLLQKVETTVIEYNESYNKYNNERKTYNEAVRYSEEIGQKYTKEPPLFDSSNINYDRLNEPIVNICQKLVNYSTVRNELNSVNAEGNLSSDVINNSYITNLIKQINYANKKDAQAGLRNLLEEINKGEQYKYNSFFWGIKGVNGKYIQEGLFMRDDRGNVSINPNAQKLIQISLFNGVKDMQSDKSALYAKMSKGDYFATSMVAYFNPIIAGQNIGSSKAALNASQAGYFFRTPSDAPKNFIIQAPKLDAKNTITALATDIAKYADKRRNEIDNYALENTDENYDKYLEAKDKAAANKNNIWSVKDIYSVIKGELSTFNFNRYYYIENEDGTISIPIVYKTKDSPDIVWIKGNKIEGEINNILYNIEIEGISSVNDNKLSDDFYADIADILKQEGIENGSIDVRINRAAPIFAGFRQNVIEELNMFINQLNYLFDNDSKGNWVLRKDTNGLIERVHFNKTTYDDKGRECILVEGKWLDKEKTEPNSKAGKLSGNFFSFQKLFNTKDYKAGEELERALLLYGETSVGEAGGLIQVKGNTATLNINSPLIRIENGKIVFNETQEVRSIIDNIVEQWIKSFNKEIVAHGKQYQNLLQELQKSNEDLVDFVLNTANAYMQLDDILEGDVKFYKDAKDFLKRAKEVQAGGTAYAGFDINDTLSAKIKETIGYNGAKQEIKFGNTTIDKYANAYSPVEGYAIVHAAGKYARNGFRAVTINNTVRPSKQANNIQQELFNYLKDELGEVAATKKAVEIANGYREASKTNDAQSFITIEEFMRRRYADGTFKEYEDIFQQLYELRTGQRRIEDIDISKINSRIQVQKNFYYDHKYDSYTGVHYPRQIKNAEFVLIPELLEGTQLKELYNFMYKYDIGQVNTNETSKAAKKNVLTFWDNDGNINPNFEQDLISNNENAIEDYYYRFLYKQQDVPEHMKDAQNKAGVQITKKICDNANESVKPYINTFFKNYCANIKEDFKKLLFNMGWKEDKNGKLVNIDSDKQTLDFTDFYKKARIEAQRLGMDSNFIEYLTPDEFGNPAMPNYMNNVSSKLESIAQAIFNSSITRQKFPGWHAAQVTQVGHGMKVLDNNGKLRELKYHPKIIVNKETGAKIEETEYNKLSDEDKNKYEVKQEAYGEVMIPRWSNLIPNTPEALEMIQKEGLDIQLAYRIPTEGKQSVSIVKVVGFLNDVYGSTIMLPDEWVTQTGSDFDVDSVYGICHSLKVVKDKNGNIKRIKKYSADDFKTDYAKYKYYIEDNINNKISSDIEDEFHEDKYKVLQKRLRDVVKKLRTEKDNRDNLYKELTNIGKEAGLLTFNEFSKLDEVDKLPRVVRNNNILDAMIAIMADNNSREENYSRSNFDKLSSAMKEMDKARRADSVNRSVYNPFDQMDFMENAMGGASLKAFSVTRDTFNSVNNYAKGYLGKGHEIIAEYDLTEKDANGEFIYDAEMMIKAYGLYNETTKKGDVILLDKDGKKTNEVDKAVTARVKHYRLANSYNNRNVVGELITVYSSQTTAHVLDAIKEGSIFNENEFTFGTFKTLIDTGMDYRTAIAFLMQPAITTINEVNNESNSLYLTGGDNTVQKAIKRIAAKAGFKLGATDITDYSNYESILLALNSNEQFRNAYRELFGAEISTQKPIQEQQFTLNAKVLKSRLESSKITNISELSQKDNDIKNAVFDIAVCLAFNKINKTTKNLEKVLRCCNPDNFGAKQTIRETRTIVDNVIAYGFTDNEVGNTVMCGSKRLIEKLYPGFIKIEKNEVSNLDELVKGDIDVENSVYPFLAAFFKYATLTSVDVNKQLFPTENDVYNAVLNAVQVKLGVTFTPKQYREYKQYMMNMIYSQVPIINTPLTVTKEGWLNDNNEAIVKSTENDTNYWNAEISRIFGFETTQKINFDIKDLFNPTEEELSKFNALTPAQKISWIQTHINGDLGIFNYLNVNLNNQFELKRKGFTHQSIKFTDSAENMDDIYIEFGTSFFNKSPIFRLAITDLIKYAFVVDGFKFKRGAIDKVITNNSLYKNIEDMGTGIVPAIREIFGYYANPAAGVTDEFIDKFIRSHKEYCKSIKLGKPENNKGISNTAFQFNVCNRGNGLIFIPFDGRFKTLLNEINVEDAKSPQDYIVVNRSAGGNKISTLYKIDKHESGVYLIPMNLLEPNETGDYSVNPNNNKYGDISFYNTVIAEAENIGAKEYFIDKDNKIKLKDKYKEYIIPRYKFNLENNAIDNINEFQNISVNGTEIQKAELNKLFKDIEAYIQSPVEERGDYGVIRSDSFYISEQVGKTDIITQSIPTEAGNILVTIRRYSPSPAFKSNLHKDLINNVSSNNTENIQKVRIEERDAYRSALASKTEAHKYYRIEHITEESVREEFEKQQQENRDNFNDEAYAITTDITDDYIDNANRITEVDETSVAMIAALRRAERRGDDIVAKELRKLDIKGINSYRSKDIKDNRRNIYHILSDYISSYADMIDKQMKHYVIDDKEYNIGEHDLYEILRSNPDEVPNIVKLLLEAITFGDTFGNIMNLPIDGMDEDTKIYIQKIRDSINKIRNSSIIKQGFDNMFNKYIANEFANNPNIRMNVVNLKDTFGDSGWWETNIGDIAMLSNKQVQVIVKIVNRIMNQAVMQDAPRKKNEFLKRFDNILAKSGSFRWENVIDSNGRLIRPYTAKFLTDRDKLVNAEKQVKDEYVNKKYKKYSNNYNHDNGRYNNYVTLSPKEKEMQSLLQETMDFFAEHNKHNTFVDQGYIPRRRKVVTDTKWVVNQLLGVTGLEFRNDSEDRWNAKVDYANDYEVENDMLKLLKGKGYQELEEIRPKGIGETDESYHKYLQDTKKKNKEIKKHNLEIDKELFDKDYRSVFAEAISNQVVINARNKAKNWLYLLQEDLKNTEAVKISKFTGRPVINKRTSTDVQDNYHTISQDNTLKQVYGFTRRLIFEQFKEKSKLNKYADLARNITSAKYMIFNVTGGIANIGTGFANIMGEAFAGDNLSKNDIREAIGMYMNNSLQMIADMYKDKSNNFAVALTKYFKVVDFDAMTERVRGETAGEYARRMRNLMYSLQSGGEHFMQNTVLFAVLKSNKIFDDIDGVKRCGSFSEYIWKLEYDTMVSVISKDKDLLEELKEFKRIIRQDKTEQFKYDTFKHNIIEDFLRAHASKEIIQEYIHAKNQAIKRAKEEWKTKPTIIDLLELKNGEIVPKAGAEITPDMINDIKNKTVNLNKKIHGVYDKLGAALIEFTWWGSLVMQYHKHLYPGVMKRFRRRGYYNEQTNTIEVGSYVAFVDFLGKEFRNVVSDAKKQGDGYVGIAIASAQNTFKAVINTITNIKTNWNLMSPWERNAVKRCLGDLYGILSALLLGITIYAMTDDDDEKESNVVATGLYLADRLLSESQMYTPWGLYSEGKILWSSPIAAYNGPSDLIKIMDYSARWLFDEDFDPVYSTGIYKGKNKVGVLIKRNIPIYRVIERLNNMTKNNSYYRINEKALNMKISKYIADQINPD